MYLYLLFFPFIFLPVFGQSIPDFNDPYAPIFTDKPIYSWTEKVKMKIIAPSWNSNANLIDSIGHTTDHPIRISTREHSITPYRFTETASNSGIFVGEIILTGFLHDANGDGSIDTTPKTSGNGPTDGFLQVGRDSAVTISFEFADGVVLIESVPVSWNIGTIQFSQNDYFLDDSVIIRAIDFDMNLDPDTLDHLPIQIFSDSDIAGIVVDSVETSKSSSLFVATITLSPTMTSSGNRLHVLPGDKIFGKYDDHTLPRPYSTSSNLEIKTFATVDSSTPPIERLKNSPIIFSDSLGNRLQSFSSNKQIQIAGTITNNENYKQKFVYLFQVKNTSDSVESISWVQGELTAKQSLDISQSWVPKKSGTYQIETFVWNSLADTMALSPVMLTSITVE
jgi:hypothetical protein